MFDQFSKELVGVEAYTNLEKWTSDIVSAPSEARAGRLIYVYDEADDRVDLGVTPIYEFSHETSTLRVVLNTHDCTSYCEVGEGIVIGLVSGGGVGEMIVSNLGMEE